MQLNEGQKKYVVMLLLFNLIPDKALGRVDAKVDAGVTRITHLATHHCYDAPALDL